MMKQQENIEENAVNEKRSCSGISAEALDTSYADEAQDLASDIIDAKYTEVDYKRVLRKIDCVMLPFMWLCCGIQQADKSSISAQATFGLQSDTGLVGQQYSWLTTAFFISYLIGEAPANYLMQRFGVNKILSIYMFLWGTIVLCVAFTQNFAQLVALRSLQGFLECIMGPAFLIIAGSFYTTREHPMRSIIWGTSQSGMDIITQLVMYAVGSAAQKKHNSNFGTLDEARWLSKEEKCIAAARVAGNQTGSDRGQKREWRWDQVLDAAKDPQTYFFFFAFVISGLPNSGTAAFGNLVYVSFGFTNLETIVKGTVPLDLVSAAWFLIVGLSTLKWPHTRFFFMVVSTIPAFIGMLALGLLPKEGMLWTRWGLYLMTATGRLPGLLMSTLLPSNIAGRTKKSVISIVMYVGYCVGSATGAQTFRAEWAPRYIPSIIICGIMYGMTCALFIAWRLYYVAENKRRAKKIAEMGMTPEQSARQGKINGESDMTDRQNLHFKYSM
ncbi:major facilitator superfamily domain-containing protein [Trichoderma chlorosporum]